MPNTKQSESQAKDYMSSVHIATVADIHLNNEGQVMYVLIDYRGNYLYPCIELSHMGGFDGRFATGAYAVKSKVLCLCVEATGYYIIGGVTDPDDAEAISVDGIKTAIDAEVEGGRYDRVDPDIKESRDPYEINTDYRGVHLHDYHVEADDNFINLSSQHGLTIEGAPRVSVQIPDTDEAIFRVSADGRCDNRLLNADPFLDRLFNHMALMEQKVRALEAYCVSLQGALSALSVGPTAPVGAAASTAATQLTAMTAIQMTDSATVRQESNDDINGKIQIP